MTDKLRHEATAVEALEAKKAKLREAMEDTRLSELELVEPPDLKAAASLYERFQPGDFQNLERNRARWVAPGPKWHGPDIFEFIPKGKDPDSFRFVPPKGQPVVPRNMFTDVGTIPRLAGVFRRGLTPWGYAPAYLVHDWEFEQHHCDQTAKTFDEVRDTMMQCVKTLMEKGLVPKNLFDFWLLYQAIDSLFAHRYWDRDPPTCTLPPDNPDPLIVDATAC
jgi:hypothetical protein